MTCTSGSASPEIVSVTSERLRFSASSSICRRKQIRLRPLHPPRSDDRDVVKLEQLAGRGNRGKRRLRLKECVSLKNIKSSTKREWGALLTTCQFIR